MRKFLVSSLVVTSVLLGTMQATHAETPKLKLTQQQDAELRHHLAELGVDEKTQDKLIKKLENGELWDSMNPEKTKEVEKQFVLTKPGEVRRHVFSDGSVLQESLTGGTSYCGSGYCMYNDVEVGRTTVAVTAKFWASYTINSGKSYADRIRSAYNPYIFTTVGEYLNPSLAITIPDEYIGTAGYAAEASLKFDVKIGFDSVGTMNSYWLKLYVGSDSAWQGASF